MLQDLYIYKLEHKFNINITKVLKTPILANLIPNSRLTITLKQVYIYISKWQDRLIRRDLLSTGYCSSNIKAMQILIKPIRLTYLSSKVSFALIGKH